MTISRPLVINCPKCHRGVIHRPAVITTFDEANGVAVLEVVLRRDPHICPRPTTNRPMMSAGHSEAVDEFLDIARRAAMAQAA